MRLHPCRFQTLEYDALNVRSTAWFEDMAAFRGGTRDLDVKLGNLAHTACELAPTLATRLDVLAEFAAVATREGFK